MTLDEPEVKELILTKEQKQILLDMWSLQPEPPALKDLSQKLFNKEVDGRSVEGRAIKKFLAEQGLRAKAAQDYTPKTLELSDEHKEYASNNASTMTALDMARILFKNPSLTNLNKETRVINEYLKTLDKKVVFGDTEDVPQTEYEPPNTPDKALKRINKYVHEGWDKEKLNSTQKKQIQALIGYMHTYRFLHQMRTYESEKDRTLFEDSYVRFIHNKQDLSQEEINQYIILCGEIVMAARGQERVERLQRMLEDVAGAADAENVKISMSLVEAITTANREHNDCIKRQQDLFGDLTEVRSKRLSKEIKETASILNLVALWKQEESRKELIELANKDKVALAEGIKGLADMDDIRCKILGLSKEEALQG